MIMETSFLCQHGAISLYALLISGKCYFYTRSNVIFNYCILFCVLVVWSLNITYTIPIYLDINLVALSAHAYICTVLHCHKEFLSSHEGRVNKWKTTLRRSWKIYIFFFCTWQTMKCLLSARSFSLFATLKINLWRKITLLICTFSWN